MAPTTSQPDRPNEYLTAMGKGNQILSCKEEKEKGELGFSIKSPSPRRHNDNKSKKFQIRVLGDHTFTVFLDLKYKGIKNLDVEAIYFFLGK